MNKYILVTALILCGAYLSFLNGEEKEPKVGGPFEVELDKPASKYWMYVPEEYTPYRSWPLMVVLHGSGSSARNIIGAYTNEAAKNKFILAAVNSQDRNFWSAVDEKFILGAMEDVRKNYTIDADRVFLSGFSAGGFMTCRFGFKYHKLFRIICPMGGALMEGCDKNVREHLGVFIICGDQDPGYPLCKQLYETLQKQKADTELHTMPGVGHTIDPTALPWLFDKIKEHLDNPVELLKRGKKASLGKRYLDAIGCFNKIIEENKDKIATEAQQELKKIDKIALEKYNQALKKIDSKKNDEGAKLLKEIITQYEGVSVWEKAKEKLNEIEPGKNKKPEEK